MLEGKGLTKSSRHVVKFGFSYASRYLRAGGEREYMRSGVTDMETRRGRSGSNARETKASNGRRGKREKIERQRRERGHSLVDVRRGGEVGRVAANVLLARGLVYADVVNPQMRGEGQIREIDGAEVLRHAQVGDEILREGRKCVTQANKCSSSPWAPVEPDEDQSQLWYPQRNLPDAASTRAFRPISS